MRRLADIVKVNILLCDDEKENLKLNEQYVQVMNKKMKIDGEVYCFEDSSEELVEFIKKIRIDIAILDIMLKSGNGIDVARTILEKNKYANIIFVTRYTQYTAQAFQVEAIGYLEKPIDPLLLQRIYQRAVMSVQGLESEKKRKTLLIKAGTRQFNLELCDIYYIEKVQKKVVINIKYGQYGFYGSIVALEEQLGDSFLRINQGTLINKSETLYIEKSRIYLKSGNELHIGRTYASRVRDELKKGLG